LQIEPAEPVLNSKRYQKFGSFQSLANINLQLGLVSGFFVGPSGAKGTLIVLLNGTLLL